MKSLADVQNALLAGAVHFVLPEVVLVGTACLLFVLAVVYPRRTAAVGLALIGLTWAVALTYSVGSGETTAFWAFVEGTPYSPHLLAAIDPTGLAALIRWLALASGFIFVLLAWPEIQDHNAGEYLGCLLVMIAGSSLIGRVNDLVSLFLALEMVSIPTYVLLYLPLRGRGEQEAAVKYFLLSILSSGVLLFGFSYLYGLTGTTNLGALLAVLSAAHQHAITPMALIAILMVIAAFGFRISAVPFQFYAPDVYQGGPTGVVAQIAFIPKFIGFVALVRVLGLVIRPQDGLPFEASTTLIPLVLWVMAIVTMTFGNVLALLQDDLKRLLAYSGIAHSGYMLIGIVVACGLPGNSTPALSGVDATLFYLIAYGLMTVGAFALILYWNSQERPIRTIDNLGGLGESHPLSAALMTVFLFSLIGMPMTAGFAGKFMLFVSAFEAPVEPPMQNLYRILAVVAAVNAAIGAVYYLRIVGVMYLRDPLHPVSSARRAVLPLFAACLCAIGTVAFGVYPRLIADSTQQATPLVEVPGNAAVVARM
ncbi:MAG: NADH-quinone oxidoreductase subunit N [Bacteroidales bacterium]|nr:NADH-quinone oxidoreductase subunit N [Bacteroidales bacterium]